MPKSKPRAGAVAKAKRARQAGSKFPRRIPPATAPQLHMNPGHRHENEFALSPWAAWRAVSSQHPDPVALQVLERLPFHTHGGSCTTLTELAADTVVTVQGLVESFERLEAEGLARWDHDSQTIILFTPDDRPLLQLVDSPIPASAVARAPIPLA